MMRKKLIHSSKSWGVILFLINPFVALIAAINSYASTISKNIVWLFCGFYGLTFYPVRDTMDSFRHREDFASWVSEPNMTFAVFKDKLLSGETNIIDVLMPLLKFLVSRFTSDPNIFYAILGLIFGYFFSRNIWFLITYVNKKIHRNQALMILLFAFIIGPWEINSFRFWLGAHVFIYYIFRVLILKKKWYIIGLLITPFIHFGFIFSVAVFLLYLAIGNKLTLYYIMLTLAFLVNTISASTIQSLIPATSVEALNKRAENYTDEGYIAERAEEAESRNFLVDFRITLLNTFTYLMAFLLFFYKRKEISENSPQLSLLCFIIFLMAIGYAAMNAVPTFGRYFRLSMVMFYGYLFIFFSQQKNKWYTKNFYHIHASIAFLYAIFEIRIWFDSATLDTFLSNPFTSFFYHSNNVFINVIK